jgi:hypothetical protein
MASAKNVRMDDLNRAIAPVEDFVSVSLRLNAERETTFVGDILPGSPLVDEDGNPLTMAGLMSRLTAQATRGVKPGENAEDEEASTS